MEGESSTYESLRAWILQLRQVREVPHRVGGVEFQVDGVEFMHSHGPSRLDIRLSKEDQASILKTGEALPHRAQVHAEAGWVSFQIKNSQDLANAKKGHTASIRECKEDSDLTPHLPLHAPHSPPPAGGPRTKNQKKRRQPPL